MTKKISKPRTSREKLRALADLRIEAAYREVAKGSSLRMAAKKHRVGRTRLSQFVRENADVEWKPGTKIVIKTDNLVKLARIFSRGRLREVRLYPQELSRAMSFMNAVGRFLKTNNPLHLKDFDGKSVMDVSGKHHPFETNPNRLYEISAANEIDFLPLYKDVVR